MIDVMKEVEEVKHTFTIESNFEGVFTIYKDNIAYVGFRSMLFQGYVSPKAKPLSSEEMLYLINTL